MTHTSDVITYFSVVTRETECISLNMAAVHDLEVKAADVLNALVIAPNEEKMLTALGPEFGDNADKSASIAKAFGLKSAGASFRAHLSQCMQE